MMLRTVALSLVFALSAACGASTTSSSPDASSDTAASDVASNDVTAHDGVAGDVIAPMDAPECPRPMPLRRRACPVRDQLCFYSCGTVFRCTAIGWDHATDVDAGPPCP